MERILKSANDDALSTDDWSIWEEAEDCAKLPDDASNWLLPLSAWQEQGELLATRGAKGMWLETDADPDTIAADVLAQLELISVNFKVFSDGRGLSLARLLRSRNGYQGELRAIGDLLPDVLEYMYRCGFNSFVLRCDEEFTAAKAILKMQEHYYQTSEIESKPLFLRKS